MIIYKCTNIVNGKCYIGKTIRTMEQRIKSHIHTNRKTSYFFNALIKYGIDNFKWEVLCELENKNDLNEMEIFCIEIFDSKNNGYNMTIGGEGGSGEMKQETKNKISESNRGKPKSDEHKKNMISKFKLGQEPWNKGLKMSDEQKLKLSLSHIGKPGFWKGKHLSDDTKRKISDTKKNNPLH